MKLIIGDKVRCLKTINNLLGWKLFIEGDTYEVLNVTDTGVTLNHILYANEFEEYDFNFIELNFLKI
jgi:hypothetical protein